MTQPFYTAHQHVLDLAGLEQHLAECAYFKSEQAAIGWQAGRAGYVIQTTPSPAIWRSTVYFD